MKYVLENNSIECSNMYHLQKISKIDYQGSQEQDCSQSKLDMEGLSGCHRHASASTHNRGKAIDCFPQGPFQLSS